LQDQAASPTSPAITNTPTAPIAYQGKVPCCQNLVLQSNATPTLIVQTPPLPAGNYLVNAMAGAGIAPNDQITCSIALSTSPTSNDGIFGSAGNDGTGTLGLTSGTATIVDAVVVSTAGTSLELNCSSFHPGNGTYVSEGSLTALRVGTLIVN